MAERYSFGRFTLDPAERSLCADGEPVALGSTDLRLLLALVESAGSLVTKDDLVSRVWGRTAVADNVLYVHVNALRKTLGEDCIVNKQGRGYRFVAPVRRSEQRAPRAPAGPRRGNLPGFWTDIEGPARLIGRSEQLRTTATILGGSRLVTLAGPGGVGKTRLALQVASEAESRFADGAWLVELAALNDPELVPGAVAAVLGVKVGGNATPLDTLARWLARRSLLIVLDNCEHVIGACARAAETLLAASPGLSILATSREPLSCSGEQVMDVPPLAVPPDGAMQADAMRGTAAIELFAERARSAHANFRINDDELALAARICRRVDGLPLAVEMVAGWAGMLGLETLDAKLDGSMNAWLGARSTAPPRHSTLRATLEWSHELLSKDEQAVLRRLAVFAGSFSMADAEAVAGDTAIPEQRVFQHVARLVRKSMLAVVPGSRAQRYRLLETTRAFMLEKLASSADVHAARRRHATHVLHLLERAKCESETTSDAAWLERYGPMLDDLRGALDWAMGEESNDAVALAGASWPLWRELSLRTEGRRWLGAAAARLRGDTPAALEARLRRGLGDMWSSSAAMKTAHEEIARAVVLYRGLGERADLGCALTALAYALFMLGRVDEAEKAILEALSLLESAGRPRTLAAAYSAQLCIEATLGRLGTARLAGEKAAQLCAMAGADRLGIVVAGNLIELSLETEDLDGAIARGRSLTMRLADTAHSDIRGFLHGLLAAALTLKGDLDGALAAAREAAPFLRDEGTIFWLFDHLALRAALAGHAEDAALIAGYADAVHEKFGRPREPIGQHAAERLASLLRESLSTEKIAHLGRMGAQLSEDQITSLALVM